MAAAQRLLNVTLILAATGLLMLPALWNGFPFIFFDSGDYLSVGLSGHGVVYRDPVYGFVALLLHGHISLWGVALGQSLLTSWILFEVTAQILPQASRNAGFLTIVTMLSFGSSLPWFSAQVMPDCFGALAVLAMALLALGDLSEAKKWLLATFLAVALACHLTILPIGVACLALLLVVRLLPGLQVRPRLIAASLAVLVAPGLVIGANLATGAPAVLSQSGHVFLLGRLVQDGLAKRTLDRLCPDPHLKLCAVKDALPPTANDFLWGDSEAFALVGGWLDSKAEAQRIIGASLRFFPRQHLISAVTLTAEQLATFATADGLQSQAEPWGLIEAEFPADLAAYVGAKQQRDQLPAAAINRVHRPLIVLALLLTPLLIRSSWRQDRRLWAGLMLIFAAIFTNAGVCAVLSNPGDRYESRLIWLLLLAVGLGAARTVAARLQRLAVAPA